MDLEEYKILLEGTKRKKDGSSTFQELNDFLNKNIPSRIFRYRKCNEASLNALLENKLFFSTPNMFNDPYDCLVYFDLNKIKSEIETIGNATTKRQLINIILEAKRTGQIPPQLSETFVNTLISLNDDVIEKVIESRDDAFFEEVRKEYLKNLQTTERLLSIYHNKIARIACLAEEKDNILMWSHYADSHSGFVIEYDTKSLYTTCPNCPEGRTQFNCNDWKVTGLFPILYTDQRYDATQYLSDQINIDMFEKAKLNNFWQKLDPLDCIKVSLYKHRSWSYEKEWRLFLHSNNNSHFISVKPVAVYLGCRISYCYEKLIKQYAIENDIDLYQMKEEPENLTYNLVPEKLTI